MATIQVSEDVKRKLLEISSRLQLKSNHKVSFDEAIRYLVNETKSKQRNKARFQLFYACLGGKNVEEGFRELRELRRGEDERIKSLERKTGSRLERPH